MDKEIGWSQSTNRYPELHGEHFITADLRERADMGEGAGDIFGLDGALLLQLDEASVDIAAHTAGDGRAVYFAGLPYTFDNTRLLHRAIYWAARREQDFASHWTSTNPDVEVAVFPDTGKVLVMNNSASPASTAVAGRATGLLGDGAIVTHDLDLAAMESRWLDI